MYTISFMSANYVARQVDYHMQEWGHGDRATNEYFRPIETYAVRLDQVLQDIRALGFSALDLWTAHLHHAWATDEHIQIARDLLKKHNLKVVSLAGGFGATPEEFERSCDVANAVGCKVLGGFAPLLYTDRERVVKTLQAHDLKLGLENHPEKTPEELLAKIGDGGAGRVGACVDTGWFGTQGYDAARGLDALRDHLFHVHLKDVLHVGEPHDTCAFGRGVVPLQECVETLRRIGYSGAISIEHEPNDHDPTSEIAASYALLRKWLDPLL